MPNWEKWFGRLKKYKARTPPQRPVPTSELSVTVGNGLNVALRILKEAVTGIGVPGLEATVNGVVGVINLIKDVRDNAIDLRELNDRISSLANTISMAPNLHPGVDEVPESLLSRVDVFLYELHAMLQEVQQMFLDTNPAIRAANSQAHKEAIENINTRISRLLSQFTAQGILSVGVDLAGARQDIRAVGKTQKALAVTQEYLVVAQEHLAVTQEDLVATQYAQGYENLINAIPRVHARYNDTSTKPSRPCHPGTRIGLLQSIRYWIDEDLDATPYFWLCGEVGVGKSTVAHTIAQEQEALQKSGASFFFSRHDDSRRTPHLLFSSIAYQLARFDRGIYNALAKVLKPDPDIVKRSLTEQFKQLVLQPLSHSGISPVRTVVIVIDGLDESSDPVSILDVLTLGIDDVGVRLRILISSRPCAAILSKFKDPRLYHLTSETQFHNINPQTLSSDVAAYLFWSLGDLALRWQLPSPWPPKEQLDELIQRAAGLFIIASTYNKYIEDPEEGNPEGQLARIISRRRGQGSSPLAELDALYDQVLEDLKSKLPFKMDVTRDIITTVILAPEGISVSALAGLISVDPFDVRLVLRRLTAVILLPEHNDHTIVPFHASFGEYIQDSTRCTVRELSVDAEYGYGRIVARCFDVIMSAANGGIVGVEYDCARGLSWMPKHLEHIVEHLTFYLSHAPHAQVEEAKATFAIGAVWTLLNIGFPVMRNRGRVMLIDQADGFGDLPRIEGFSPDERASLLGRFLIDQHALVINQNSENAATARGSAADEYPKLSQRQTLHFVPQGEEVALGTVQSIRCWKRYRHSNVLSIEGIDVEFRKNIAQKVLVFVTTPKNIERTSSLQRYLEKNDNLAVASRIRIALGVADGLRYLHRSTPAQPHNGINPHQIMIAGRGQPILYPSRWNLHFQSEPPPNTQDDNGEITCKFNYTYTPDEWHHWNPTGRGHEWQKSLSERLRVDVWDFGSILYQMITGEEPVTTFSRLAKSNATLGYSAFLGTDPDTYWDNDEHYKSRYEMAVSLLMNSLQVSEDIKELLQSCWIIRPQDRPPMSEVFKRLKTIVEDTKM